MGPPKDWKREYDLAYRERHRAYIRERERIYRATPEAKAAHAKRQAEYKARHPERGQEVRRVGRKVRAKRVRHATPTWADLNVIKGIYRIAAAQGLHVDHIVPLTGKLVCGLHVENNLQLLTKVENSRKGNKFTPTVTYGH